MDFSAKEIMAKRRASANIISKERREYKRLENLNQRRNIKVEETEKKVLKPRVDRELEAWRKRRNEEKKKIMGNKKPAFKNCITVKHTGGTPHKVNFSLPFRSKAFAVKDLVNPKPEKNIKETRHNYIPRRILIESNKENFAPPFDHLDNVTRRVKSGLEPPIAGPIGLQNVKINNLKKTETSTKPEPKKFLLSKNVTKLVKDDNGKKEAKKLNKKSPQVYKEPTEADKQYDKLRTAKSRLLLLVLEWVDKKQTITKKEHIEEIDSVIGLTRLLIKSKLKEFETLIITFNVQKNKQRISVEDLNGFWNKICMEIIELDSKYNYLETFIKNN